MAFMESLADFLDVPDPRPEQSPSRERDWSSLADIAEPEQFCRAIVRTREFRQYLMNGIVLGDIPQSLMLRILDLAGWQKPPERIEVRDTTAAAEDLTPEQLEARAARLSEMARFLRRAEQFDEPLTSESVH